MEETEIIAQLERKGVKATANRILVLKELHRQNRPVSLSDLERLMPNMDKSSIFRTLTLFLEHDIVHGFEDGRGMMDYELCASRGKCNHSDAHFHFFCESCQRTFCLENLHVPDIELPRNFQPHTVSLVIKGICPECASKDKR